MWFWLVAAACAADTLPYTNRTHAYSGWQSSVRGDDEVVGMAGAMIGVSDGWTASGQNPAGLAMTMDNWGLHLGGNSVHDGNIQNYDQPMQTSDFGMTANPYPWGFALGWWTPSDEGQPYALPGYTAPVQTEVRVREYKASIARLFFHDQLSVGINIILDQSVETLEPGDVGPSQTHHAYGLTGGVGLMYQLPRRWILGLTYTPPQTFGGDPSATTTGINHFFQDVESPYRFGLGTGWFPNRFFHFGAQLVFVGPIENAALLSDDSRIEGDSLTVMPQIGGNYRFMEYKNFRADVSAGTYLEWTRIVGTSSRLHATFSVDGHFWFFNLGIGADKSTRYTNSQVSVGVDIIRLARSLQLIPPDRQLPYGGFFSNPFYLDDEGLPKALNQHWQNEPAQKNPLEISTEVPALIQKQLQNAADALGSLKYLNGKPEAKPSPTPR